ncbi:hypothetical protein [Ammoniphilus sp. YIM 78166]|uniref:hypothetical protein n=1 Tax=Ammoniphilus sp. YIM 78166 TaxID=1644106 RepID=UPI0010703C5F|nr:hypothetical protein [Ammoniphilus sp. YIM 78166]
MDGNNDDKNQREEENMVATPMSFTNNDRKIIKDGKEMTLSEWRKSLGIVKSKGILLTDIYKEGK